MPDIKAAAGRLTIEITEGERAAVIRIIERIIELAQNPMAAILLAQWFPGESALAMSTLRNMRDRFKEAAPCPTQRPN